MPQMDDDSGADPFDAERARLVRLASRVLGDAHEAEDVVQQAWLRWHRHAADVEEPAAWLTTVTTRLCLDRLKARLPVPADDIDDPAVPDDDAGVAAAADPADDLALADTVGAALQVVLDRLSPRERVAFVLHDTFGFEFAVVGEILGCAPTSARKLASRARAKVAQPTPEDELADWEVVDAFLAAARGGDLARLVRLLAPDCLVTADDAARTMGTPERIDGREAVAAFFDGAAKAAFPVLVDGDPGAAWVHRGETKVAFCFTVRAGVVHAIRFAADPELLGSVRPRDGSEVTTTGPLSSSE